jgi:hypothetical protein
MEREGEETGRLMKIWRGDKGGIVVVIGGGVWSVNSYADGLTRGDSYGGLAPNRRCCMVLIE